MDEIYVRKLIDEYAQSDYVALREALVKQYGRTANTAKQHEYFLKFLASIKLTRFSSLISRN